MYNDGKWQETDKLREYTMMKSNISLDIVRQKDIKEKLRQETLSRWKEAEAGKVTPHDKVIDWLDSWGNDNEKSMQ
jgi:predicted transcriptional regulator